MQNVVTCLSVWFPPLFLGAVISKAQYKTMVPGYHHILTFRCVYKRSFQYLQAYHMLYFQQYNIIFMLNRAMHFNVCSPMLLSGTMMSKAQ